MLQKIFPTFSLKNIGLYYLLGIFLNGWFILPNWVFYFSQYIDLVQIGIVEGVAILVGIIMEVPSGALSDLLGKKKTIIFGALSIILSSLILIFSTEFIHFLVGNTIMFIGFSFLSGATEAFAYDSMVEQKLQKHYDVVASKYTSISIAATVFATFMGGFLYGVDPRLPFVAWIIFMIIAIVILLIAHEPAVDTYEFSVKNYLRQLKDGTQTLFGQQLKTYLVTIIGIAMFVKLYQGMVRQAMAADFAFTGETFGYALAAIMIPATMASFKFDSIRKKFGEKRLLIILCLSLLTIFIIAYLSTYILAGITIFLVMMLAEKLSQPLISVIVNHRIDSKHRATSLSTIALLSQIPYIILVFGFAHLTQPANIQVLYIVFILFALFLSFSSVRVKPIS